MPVGEMLHRMSSYEISEWMAYERATGPLRGYDEDLLARIHEQLQTLNHLYGAQAEENPIPVPTRVLRPYEIFLPEVEEETMSRDEFDNTQF